MMESSSRKYDKRRIEGICAREILQSQGAQGDEIEANRTQAIEYYLGRPRGDEVEGLSKVQSLDVADMVEAVLSFMAPALSSQSLVQFASVGADDEEQAAKESRIIQSLVRSGRSNAYVAIQEATKDALLLRNGIIKVWVEVRSEVERETYTVPGDGSGPGLEAVQQVMAPGPMDSPETVKEITAVKKLEKAKGAGQAVWLWSISVKETQTFRALKMAAVDPVNFRFPADAASMDVETLRFVSERQLVSRSMLVQEGIDEKTVTDLPKYGASPKADRQARNRASDSGRVAEDFWQQEIEIDRCYVLLGTGDGGRSERWLVTMANQKKMLSHEKVKCVPYGVGAAILAGHQFQGLSLFDKLKETQDTKTGFLRAWLNNAQFTNVPRALLREGMVDEDSFYDVRVGGGVRVQGAGAVEFMTVPDIGPACLGGLQYQDKMRAERGGASLEMMAPGLQLNSPTAAGTDREMSVKEQLAALMAANLAQTMLRGAYLVAHKVARYEMGPKVQAQDGGEWLEDAPGDWGSRDDVAIVIGLSPGERARRMMALGQVITQQKEILVSGGDRELTSKGQLHRALIEWTRSAGLDAPERYWTDPDSEQAQKAAAEKAEQQKTLGQAQAELLGRVKILEAQVDVYKVQLQEAGKYWSEVIRADIEEMKITGQATAQLEAAKLGAAQRSGDLMGAAAQTTQQAGALAAQPMPQAGALAPGAIQ